MLREDSFRYFWYQFRLYLSSQLMIWAFDLAPYGPEKDLLAKHFNAWATEAIKVETN